MYSHALVQNNVITYLINCLYFSISCKNHHLSQEVMLVTYHFKFVTCNYIYLKGIVCLEKPKNPEEGSDSFVEKLIAQVLKNLKVNFYNWVTNI